MTRRSPCILITTLCCLLALATSAWAGQGWYLLTPPLGSELGAVAPDAKARLSQWEHAGAFDSAQACEAAKSEAVNDTRDMYKKLREKNRGKLTDYERRRSLIDTTTWLNARCIASDDPRLRP